MNMREVSVLFRTPDQMPNGLQWFENELFVMDQLIHDVFVIDQNGGLKRVIPTETENGIPTEPDQGKLSGEPVW